MNTISVSKNSVLASALLALLLAFSAMPILAHADDAGYGCDFCGDSSYGGGDSSYGGSDYSYGGGDSSYGGYDSSYGGYDSSYGGYDSSYGSSDSSYGGYDNSYGGYDSSYGGYDTSLGGYDSSYGGYDTSLGGYDSSYGGYDSSYGGSDYSYGGTDSNFGGYDTSFYGYNPGYDTTAAYSYNPGYDTSYDYSYNPGYDTSYDYSYNPGGYTVTPPSYGGGSYGGGYSTGGGYSISQPHVATISRPITVSAPITPVIQTPPQHPVVYQQPPTYYPPQQPPYYPPVQQPAPSCTISLSNGNLYGYSYGFNNYNNPAAILTWSSQYATNATITSLGSVQTSGSRTVYPGNGQVYTMTVSGPGGTNVCQTSAYYIPTPIPTPVPTPIPTPIPTPYPVPTPIPTPIPVPVPVAGHVACSITVDRSSIQNGQTAHLSWNSSPGVTSAVLSDSIGTVAPSGYLNVMPASSRTYVLTVYGLGTSATCSVPLTVSGTYVSLTQIPYTGFDFGVTGNALYWMSLMIFAISAAYLILYYQGGMGNVMQTMFAGITLPNMPTLPRPSLRFGTGRSKAQKVARTQAAPVPQIESIPQAMGAQRAPIAHVSAPVHTRVAPKLEMPRAIELPIAERVRTTADSMTIIHGKGSEMPRLVITRE